MFTFFFPAVMFLVSMNMWVRAGTSGCQGVSLQLWALRLGLWSCPLWALYRYIFFHSSGNHWIAFFSQCPWFHGNTAPPSSHVNLVKLPIMYLMALGPRPSQLPHLISPEWHWLVQGWLYDSSNAGVSNELYYLDAVFWDWVLWEQCESDLLGSYLFKLCRKRYLQWDNHTCGITLKQWTMKVGG